jgi:hypothetical protein
MLCIMVAVFWDVLPCKLADVDGRFRGTDCLLVQLASMTNLSSPPAAYLSP